MNGTNSIVAFNQTSEKIYSPSTNNLTVTAAGTVLVTAPVTNIHSTTSTLIDSNGGLITINSIPVEHRGTGAKITVKVEVRILLLFMEYRPVVEQIARVTEY